jgi:hypothetical protein
MPEGGIKPGQMVLRARSTEPAAAIMIALRRRRRRRRRRHCQRYGTREAEETPAACHVLHRLFCSLREKWEPRAFGSQKFDTGQLFRPFGRSSVVSQYVPIALRRRRRPSASESRSVNTGTRISHGAERP